MSLEIHLLPEIRVANEFLVSHKKVINPYNEGLPSVINLTY